jgi:hypothetical protein
MVNWCSFFIGIKNALFIAIFFETCYKLQEFEETTNVICHPKDFKGPLLFSFRAKSLSGKKEASIKVEDGEWSDSFSLDFTGSLGVVSCPCGDTTYQVLLRQSS